MRQFLLAILVVLTPSLVFASSESQTFDEVDSLTNQRSVGVLITSNESEDVRVRFRLNTETGEAFATLINTGVLHVYFSDNVLSQTKNVMYRSSVMGKPKKSLWHTGHTMLTLSDVCDETEFEPYGLHNIVEMMLGKMLTVAIPEDEKQYTFNLHSSDVVDMRRAWFEKSLRESEIRLQQQAQQAAKQRAEQIRLKNDPWGFGSN
tara:strand:+ start:326 stop:940 length:615 start_codon:yes stop_codon:yes gene_type:complete